MKNDTPETQKVMEALSRNRILWVRTFAPLRRALAGVWTLHAGDAGLHLHLDGEGQFRLENESAGLNYAGKYSIAKVDESMYMVLDSEQVCYVVRIEEMDFQSIKLAWADDPAMPMWFERLAPISSPVPSLKMI